LRPLHVLADKRAYRLNCPDIADCLLLIEENQIIVDICHTQDMETLSQFLLGPCLILILAEQGLVTLHASAVMTEQHIHAFSACSGAGKSTLGRVLGDAGFFHYADDLLGLELGDQRLQTCGLLPQLKLPLAGMHRKQAQTIELQSIFFLIPVKKGEPEIQVLNLAQAMMNLLQHTVASRLFRPQLLQQHLSFCRQAAQLVNCYQMTYRKTPDQLPIMTDDIQKQIKRCQASR